MKTKTLFPYSPQEEKLNVYSHALGLLLSLFALVLLFAKAIEAADVLSYFAYLSYGISLVLLYAASTFYHNAKQEKLRRRLKVLDHTAIYLLIAGTYMPYSLLGIGGHWGFIIAIMVVFIALIGVVLKLFFTGRFELASTLSYVFLGGIVLVAIKPLIEHMPAMALSYLVIGGVFYLVGAVLYSISKIPLNHAIFHFFVLLGSTCHFLGVIWYI